jgi:hypothetical protein
MSRKRVRLSKNGINLIEVVLFGGTPRVRVGVNYLVQTPRQPEGRSFETLDAAKRFFNVQVGLRPRIQSDGQA